MTIAVVKRRFPGKRIQRSVFRILRDSALCSMSTVAPGNRAHINTAYFCYSPDLNFYFLSDPDSLHCKNVERNPSMAMMVMNSSQTWGDSDRGIQLFGACHRVRGPAAKEAERRYGSPFPGYTTGLRGTDRVGWRGADLLRSYAFYPVVPSPITILDEAEFGGAAFGIAGWTRP